MRTAGQLMSRPVRRLVGSVSVAEGAAFLLRHGISGALVVDGIGRPAGVFSLRDAAYPCDPSVARVAEVMTCAVITVGLDATVEMIAGVMTRWDVHRVFVEERGDIVGVITSMDVLRAGPGRGRSPVRA